MRSGRFSLRLFYVGAALVLFCLQESCCYVAIFSMKALRPRFHTNSVFFPVNSKKHPQTSMRAGFDNNPALQNLQRLILGLTDLTFNFP